LKALIQHAGLVTPRTHSLEKLLALIVPKEPTIIRLRRLLTGLSRYAVEFRYPGKSATKRQAAAALANVTQIRLEVRKSLGLSVE
jgi:HEPN domain-containing protein